MRRVLALVSLFLLCLAIGRCKLREDTDQELLFSEQQEEPLAQCHVKDAWRQGFRVCIDEEGIEPAHVLRLRGYLESELRRWLRPVQRKYPEVTNSISYDCGEPHLTVFVLPNQEQGFGGCGVIQVPASMAETDGQKPDQKLQAELLHLLGIAVVGIRPSYEKYGECLPDQEQSIMCYAAYSQQLDVDAGPALYPEDERAVLAQYESLSVSP